jgi:enoyl-CoA hydratase
VIALETGSRCRGKWEPFVPRFSTSSVQMLSVRTNALKCSLKYNLMAVAACKPTSAPRYGVPVKSGATMSNPLGIKTSLASSHMALEDSQTALAKLGDQYRALLTTRDFQEGRDAEAQKRPPVYEGR